MRRTAISLVGGGLIWWMAAFAQSPSLSFRMAGQLGGPVQAVAVQGSYCYLGVGLRLVVLDVSDPSAPREVGATTPFPHFVEGVAVSGGLAFVAAGGAGLRIVDVSDPARPAEVGAFDTRGYAEGVAVAGSTVYLADGPYGLRVFDVSNPRGPKEIGSAYVTNYAFEVAVAGRYAYIAAAGAGLLIADVSNPSRPVQIGAIDTPGYAYGVAVAGSTVYVADGWEGLRVVDAADPARPVEMGSYKTPGQAFGVAVSGATAFVADAFKGLRAVDVSSPAAPKELGGYEVAGGHAGSVAVAGGIAYVADRNWGLRAVDVSDPARPVQVGFYGPLGYARAVAVSGNHAYVAAAPYGLRIVDISDPARPRQVGVYDTQSYATSVAVDGRYAYVATLRAQVEYGIHVVDVSDPARPVRAGFYDPSRWGTFGFYRDMAVAGGIAYMANESGLELVRVADPQRPVQVGRIELFDPVRLSCAVGVAVSGSLAYVAVESVGVKIVDVSDPAAPRLVGTYQAEGNFAQDLAVAGNRAYLADHTSGLRVLDVSSPSQPRQISVYDTPGTAYTVAVSGQVAYVADGDTGLIAVNVADANRPALAGAFNTPSYVHDVAVAGSRVYLADGHNGLVILEAVTGSPGSATAARRSSEQLPVRAAPLGGPSSRALMPLPQPAPMPAASASIAPRAAANCVVSSAADSGPGTLRECLRNAVRGDTIAFDTSVFPPDRPTTILLASPLPQLVRGNNTIDASDAGVILDGSRMSDWGDGINVSSNDNVVRGLQILNSPNHGVYVQGKRNVIGGNRRLGRGPTGQGNVVSGSRGDSGLSLSGSGTTDNIVSGNILGLDVSGTRPLGNAGNGVFIVGGASNNRIGGAEPGEGNIASGNGANGITLLACHGNLIAGNLAGTDITGTIDLGNQSHGISMEVAASNNVVQGNLASGNGREGILVYDWGSDYNVIIGNLVGTDASGAKPIPNDHYGVQVSTAFNRIGGTRPGEGNLISGNPNGISLAGPLAVGNLVLGNLVGVDRSGARALPNRGGINLEGGSRNWIGGATAEERNVVSGNTVAGIMVASEYSFSGGNYIGTDVTGTRALGNRAGVVIGTDIGYSENNVLQGNLITGNTEAGVRVESHSFNTIRRNSIHSHRSRGIQLLRGGNRSLAAPVITSATSGGVSGMACAGCEVEIFSDAEDEGRLFEGSVMTDASGAFSFRKASPVAGPNVTATATDAQGNTSEFSAPRAAGRADSMANLSAASYASGPLAPEMIVAAYGSSLAAATESAPSAALPLALAGTTVKVLDSAGVERAAPLYFVSPGQVNYVMPAGTALGPATVTITNSRGATVAGGVEIAALSPGLFSALGTGQGLAAAHVLRIRADGSQNYEPVTQPIDLGPETDRLYLILYGTGLRRRSSLAAVAAEIGGTRCAVNYAGPQPQYPGLDQVNVLLPRVLGGRGEVTVALTVDGKPANPVSVNFR